MKQLGTPGVLLAKRGLFEQDMRVALIKKEHYWVATVLYRLSAQAILDNINSEDDSSPLNFDIENLREMQVGCFICEQTFTKRNAKRQCPGDPNR